MMTRTWKQNARGLFLMDPTAMEFATAVLEIGFGLWLMIPWLLCLISHVLIFLFPSLALWLSTGRCVTTFTTTPTYQLMGDLTYWVTAYNIPAELPWTVVIAGMGSLHFWAVLFDWRSTRTSSCFASCVMWLLVWGVLAWANWRATSTVTYIGPWIGMGWGYVRHRLAAAYTWRTN